MNWSYWKIIEKNLPKVFFLLIILGALGYGLYFTITKSDFEHQPTLYISIFAFAISGISFIVSIIFPLLSRPILDVIIEQPPVFSNSTDTAHPSSWFHRILLYNFGLKPAENCIGKLIEIRDSNSRKLTKFDSLPFYWSHQNENTSFNGVTIFGRGDYAILDVLQEFELNSARAIDWLISEEKEPIRKDEFDKLRNELPILRVHLPNPETFTYQGPYSASPGDKPVLIQSDYFLLIGFYADNGYAKPEWYKLSINLTAQAKIQGDDSLESKTVLRQATGEEKRKLN
jgi:hypothetical protein